MNGLHAHTTFILRAGISVPPLSVKSRSLRRLFNRRSWAPSSLYTPRDVAPATPLTGEAGWQPGTSHSSTTASSSQDVSARVAPEFSLGQSDATGALSNTGVHPSMEARSFSSQPSASRSSPSTTEQVSSSFSPSATPPVLPEGNDHTPRRPTKREIAMLSGSSSPASSNTPTRGLSGSSDSPSTPSATVASTEPSSDPASDAPVSVVLEEDPAALGMSRPASWHSFTLEDSHEADLATVDAISVAEVGEENKHAASEEPIPTTEESPDETDLRSDVGEASHPRSSAVEPGSTAPPMSELASSIGSLPPSSNLPIVDENTDMTGSTQLPLPPPQPAIVPPLPVIPAGTTMIIQGVVQAAEDPARPPRRRADPSTSSTNPENSTNAEGVSESTADSSNAPASNAHARLTGTFGEEAEAARRSSQDSENPSGAAELLGALLL